MEFSEKLQQLRKQNNLTQEQLAEQLFVTRTAVSKWERGGGYPNIDSLKKLSELFDITIDNLLSNDELITLAENENRKNMSNICHYIIAVLDILTILLALLPLYGHTVDDYIYMAVLYNYTDMSIGMVRLNWIFIVLIVTLGVLQLYFNSIDNEKITNLCSKTAFCFVIIYICFTIASRLPYAATLLFILFIIKVLVLLKQAKMR